MGEFHLERYAIRCQRVHSYARADGVRRWTHTLGGFAPVVYYVQPRVPNGRLMVRPVPDNCKFRESVSRDRRRTSVVLVDVTTGFSFLFDDV